MSRTASIEDLLRELAPQVLGVLLRRYGGLDNCEDAVRCTTCSRRSPPAR
jgi:predicted RNA polymerase sigma factor